MKRLLTLVAFFATIQASAQQVNPVPDYVFRNQMSVGRNAVTDTAAYFSIGPRYGATKGFMPPIVGDTATFSSGKRNGLLIFSVQKNKFLYWDSVRVQWSDMAGGSGSYILAGDTSAMLAPYLRKVDTTSMLTAYLRKGDTSSMLTNYIRHAGYGLTKSGQSFLVDTLNIATRAWRQKGLDSLAALEVSGSGTTNYVPKFTAGSTIGNSQIFDNGSSVGIGTITPQSYTGYKVIEIEGSTGGAFRLKNTAATGLLELATQSTETYFKNVSNTPITFGTNNTERLRIFANGRVFIGASPTDAGYQLDVNGTLRSVNGANFATTSGNVGIGTASPGVKLDVTGDVRASGSLVIGTGGSTEQGAIFSNANFGFWFKSRQASPVVAYYQFGDNSGNSLAMINSGGELLINTTTDAGDYKLQVVGNARIGTGKLDIASNTVYGLGVARSGTSEVAGQIYNSNGILYFGAESSTGGGIFSGSSAYAAVIGSGANYPLQFATNNITRATMTTSGNLLLGFTTDSYFLKLQVNGSIFSNNQVLAQGVNAQIAADSSTNVSPLYISNQSLTGTSAQGLFYGSTTWNTTGNPSLIDLNITNTASGATSNYIKISDGSNIFRVTKAAEVVTAAPTGGSIRKWKLGEAATVSPTSPNRTIRVEIDGTVYYLHAKTTND